MHPTHTMFGGFPSYDPPLHPRGSQGRRRVPGLLRVLLLTALVFAALGCSGCSLFGWGDLSPQDQVAEVQQDAIDARDALIVAIRNDLITDVETLKALKVIDQEAQVAIRDWKAAVDRGETNGVDRLRARAVMLVTRLATRLVESGLDVPENVRRRAE